MQLRVVQWATGTIGTRSLRAVIESLSTALKNEKFRNDGAVCIGAGRNEAFITEMRPPGSMKFI